jgi:hypothetical protein
MDERPRERETRAGLLARKRALVCMSFVTSMMRFWSAQELFAQMTRFSQTAPGDGGDARSSALFWMNP